MTRKTFYRKLRQATKKLGLNWTIKPDDSLWAKPEDNEKESYTCCPISAVYYAERGVNRGLGAARSNGRELGLSDTDIAKIMDAADDDLYGMPYKKKRIREAMVRAVTI